MISNLKSYSTMNDFGVKWLGNIPAHWEIHKLKTTINNVIQLTEERDVSELYIALEHVQGWTGNIKDAGLDISFDSQVKKFRADDVLFGKLRPYLAKVARPNRNGVCVGEFLVLRPKNNRNNAAYLEFFLRSKPVIDIINSSTFGAKMPRANWLFIGNLYQPLPPVSEQVAIIRYLSHINRLVRRLVRTKQKLITLLMEQKHVLIHRGITHGLNPNVPMKDTGVRWLGEVPKHWEVRRLKQLCSRSALYGANIPAEKYVDNGVRFLRTTDITEGGALKENGVYISPELIGDYILEDGDVLISRSGTVGRSFLYQATLHGPCSYAGYLVRFVPSPLLLSQYMFYFTMSQSFARFLKIMAISSTIENVNGEKYANAPFPLPPVSEQKAIVEYLDQATADIDTAIARSNREIELLEEYRTRLIFDVVTGKLDVREAAAALPEVDPLAEDDEPDDDLDPDTTPDEEYDTLEEEEA